MAKYFTVAVAYKHNGEQFEVNHYFETEDDIQLVMKLYREVSEKSYRETLAKVDGELGEVTSYEISEFEYKRHALSREGKRDLNMKKYNRRGVK